MCDTSDCLFLEPGVLRETLLAVADPGLLVLFECLGVWLVLFIAAIRWRRPTAPAVVGVGASGAVLAWLAQPEAVLPPSIIVAFVGVAWAVSVALAARAGRELSLAGWLAPPCAAVALAACTPRSHPVEDLAVIGVAAAGCGTALGVIGLFEHRRALSTRLVLHGALLLLLGTGYLAHADLLVAWLTGDGDRAASAWRARGVALDLAVAAAAIGLVSEARARTRLPPSEWRGARIAVVPLVLLASALVGHEARVRDALGGVAWWATAPTFVPLSGSAYPAFSTARVIDARFASTRWGCRSPDDVDAAIRAGSSFSIVEYTWPLRVPEGSWTHCERWWDW